MPRRHPKIAPLFAYPRRLFTTDLPKRPSSIPSRTMNKSSTPSDNQTSARPSLSTYRTTFDVPPSPMSSSSSASSFSQLISINEKQIIDIDSALRDVLSGIRTVEECHAQCFRSASISSKQQQQQQPETDAPDLVLNLPVSNGLVTPPAIEIVGRRLYLCIVFHGGRTCSISLSTQPSAAHPEKVRQNTRINYPSWFTTCK